MDRRHHSKSPAARPRTLAGHSDSPAPWFAALAKIARRAFCVVSTVQRALVQLRDLGVLTWIRRIVRLPDGRGGADQQQLRAGGTASAERSTSGPKPADRAAATAAQGRKYTGADFHGGPQERWRRRQWLK